MKKTFSAFTLAEVLITLGIIGVVAAMTMPTLMNQTNGAQYKAAYKKALSAISQGVTLNVALDGASFADTVAGKTGADAVKPSADDATGETIASILKARMNVVNLTGTLQDGYALPALKTGAKVCKANKPNCTDDADKEDQTISVDTYMFFNDGSMFAFAGGDSACTEDTNVTGHKVCLGVIDVNGAKGPNKLVTCDGETSGDSCTVKSPTDVYPVQFYDQTILPATDAAKAVLYGK